MGQPYGPWPATNGTPAEESLAADGGVVTRSPCGSTVVLHHQSAAAGAPLRISARPEPPHMPAAVSRRSVPTRGRGPSLDSPAPRRPLATPADPASRIGSSRHDRWPIGSEVGVTVRQKRRRSRQPLDGDHGGPDSPSRTDVSGTPGETRRPPVQRRVVPPRDRPSGQRRTSVGTRPAMPSRYDPAPESLRPTLFGARPISHRPC